MIDLARGVVARMERVVNSFDCLDPDFLRKERIERKAHARFVDGLTRIGKVPGLNAAEPTSGTRDSYNFFGEFRFPLTSPEMNILAFNSLEVTAAGRFESIKPGGDKAVPKVSVRWQPLDEQVIIRASYSQSFIAPSTFQLFGGDAQNNPFLSLPDTSAQETVVNGSNPGLKPVDAENYGFGVVITPKLVPGLSVSIDYYHIVVKNDIFRLSEQAILNDLEQKGSGSIYAPTFFFDDGSQLTTTAPDQILNSNFRTFRVPLENGAKTQTEGLDVTANYRLPTDTFGTFNVYAAANVLFRFLYNDPTINSVSIFDDNGNLIRVNHGPYHYDGQYTDRLNGIAGGQGLLPDYQINMGLTWDYQNWTYSINGRYIPDVRDLGDAHPAVGITDTDPTSPTFGQPFNDFTLSRGPFTVKSWYSIDTQLSYEFGRTAAQRSWYGGTKITVGANNVTDEKPPLVASSFEDNTDKSTYDIVGRFVYVEVSKKF